LIEARGGVGLADPKGLAGRRARFVFDAVDATPDLPDVGPVEARVERLEESATAGNPRLVCKIEAPPELKGFFLRAEMRYEEESLTHAASGRPVTVNASIEDKEKRVIAGGIATMVVARA